MRHALKIWPSQFEAVLKREKKAEVRKHDRDFRVGDVLDLLEWESYPKRFSNRKIEVEITHILAGWGIEPGYVMLSFRVLS